MSLENLEKTIEQMDKELLKELKDFAADVSEIILGDREGDLKKLLKWVREHEMKAAEFDRIMNIYEDGEDIEEHISTQIALYGSGK